MAGAELRPIRIILHFDRFRLPFRVIIDNDPQRVQHSHGARGVRIEPIAHAGFQQAVIHHTVGFGNADTLAKIADGGCRVAAAAHAAQRDHTRIVPAADEAVFDEREAFAFTGDAVVEVEPGKFNLTRRGFKTQLL